MIPKFNYIASVTLVLIVVSSVAFAESESNDIDRYQFYNDLFSTSTREGYLNKERSRQLILNDIISRPSTSEGGIESLEAVEPATSSDKNKANTEQKVRNERENTDIIGAKKPSSSSTKPAAKSSSDVDRLKNIAMNSREVRLIGPDGKEVEMKDDVPTKIVVAFENLQKEASQVWDQVNTKLDKGWNDFKTMVERAVNKQQQQQQQQQQLQSQSRSLRELPKQEKSTLVFVDDVDGYSMADDDTTKAAQSQLETAGSKIKGFFSDIGLNEDNTKKAGDALSKAGTAVSETMTKDLPDALKKASSAVSDTVTKDIPDAFKNFFG